MTTLEFDTMLDEMHPVLTPKEQFEQALASENWWDLYGAIADNGFETEECRQKSDDMEWLKANAFGILHTLF